MMYSNNTVQPQLFELWRQAKVQVKIQDIGPILMCACAVECSAAVIRYVHANNS